MKLRSILLALCLAGTSLSAAGKTQHNQAFHKGAVYLGAGLGLGSGLGYWGGLALIGNVEYAVTNDIGIGLSIGYWSYTDEISNSGYNAKYKYSIIPVIASGAYHFHVGNPKLDLGVGVSLGYYIVSSSVETSVSGVNYASASASGIAVGVFGLVRYFVADNVALRAKIGYGITFAEVGVDFRF
jgi:hypothetical protein